MRAAARVLASCLLAGVALLTLTGPAALAQPRPAVLRVLAAPADAAAPATTTTKPAAPQGPDLNQNSRDADARIAKRKLVVGVIAVVLLVIVVYGHRVRSKRRKKDEGG